MQTHPMLLNTKQSWKKIALVALFVLIVAALWLPFGFSLGALIEEWGILGLFNLKGLFFVSTLNTPLAAHALRPLTIFPHALAYFFDPDSFFYWHALTILALISKGLTTSYLVNKATNTRYWSLFAGLLIIIYPADTMQLAFRGTHINWSLSLVLLASSFFIGALHASRLTIYYGLSILAALCLFASITMYEAAFALAVLPFIILFIQGGWHSSIQQLRLSKTLVLCWLTSIALYLLYMLIVSPQIQSYQQGFINQQHPIDFLLRFPRLLERGFMRVLFGGWFDAIRMVIQELSWYAYAYLAIIVTLLYFTLRFIDRSDVNSPNKALFVRLSLSGLLLIIIGYLPYIFSESHLYISQRTFLFASLGGVLFWVACLIELAYLKKTLANVLAISMLFCGLGAQIYQFHYYSEISMIQNRILKNIVENFDGHLENKTLVLLDEGNRLNHTWMFLTGNLERALTYVYQKPILGIKICYMPSGDLQLDNYPFNEAGGCVEKPHQWEFKYLQPRNGKSLAEQEIQYLVLNKNDVIALRLKPDGTIDKNPLLENHRRELTQSSNATANRYRNILVENKWPSHFEFLWTQPNPAQHKWQFGTWWSLDTPVRGSGWREAQWQVKKFYHVATAWKSQETASLLFDLQPKQSNYLLKGFLPYIASDDIKNSIVIRINKHKVIYHWTNDNHFAAIIPPRDLMNGTNTIEFSSATDQASNLSFNLNSFELVPEG